MPGFLKGKGVLWSFLVCAAITLLLAVRLIQEGYQGISLFIGLATFASYLAWYFWVGLEKSQNYLANQFEALPHRVWLVPAIFSAIYGIYCLGTGNWEAVSWRVPVYFFAPFLVISLFPNSQQKLAWQDIIIILLIWIPVDLRWIQPDWRWPPQIGGNAFTITAAVPLIVALMVCFRRLNGIKYEWLLSKSDIKPIVINFSLFLLFALPFGLMTNFIQWGGLKFEPSIAFTFLITFLWVAVPEELLFRGLIQNLLQKSWSKHPQLAMWTASIIFGLAHINNDNQPIWAYVVLASVAGYLYGRTFNQCRSFVPAVIVHTLVDTVWVHFFRG
ncbi:MAG: CPBP family intramembrane glutamic endopeptidase [Oligoflexus sp.]